MGHSIMHSKIAHPEAGPNWLFEKKILCVNVALSMSSHTTGWSCGRILGLPKYLGICILHVLCIRLELL